jgi:hypothetical protein
LGDSIELGGVRLEVAAREKRRTRLIRARKVGSENNRASGYHYPG